jgi:hypothetical protein
MGLKNKKKKRKILISLCRGVIFHFVFEGRMRERNPNLHVLFLPNNTIVGGGGGGQRP